MSNLSTPHFGVYSDLDYAEIKRRAHRERAEAIRQLFGFGFTVITSAFPRPARKTGLGVPEGEPNVA